MALPLWAIMAATGLAKNYLIDAPKEKRQRTLAASTQRYSPWTGLQAGPIEEADPFGAALQGGVSGLGMGQQQEATTHARELQQAQIDALKAMSAKGGGAPAAVAPELGATGAPSNPVLSYWSKLKDTPDEYSQYANPMGYGQTQDPNLMRFGR